MSHLYHEEPMDTDGRDLYRSAEELENIADGAKTVSSPGLKQLQDTSSDGGPMGGVNPSAPPDTARVTIRVECEEPLPSRWKVLLEMALQSWSNTKLFKQTGQRCDFGRIQSLPDQDIAEVEISPSKALDVLKKMKKADLCLKGFRTVTTVHFLVDQKGLPVTEDLYRSPEELEKNADGAKSFSSLDPKQLQDTSGDGGSSGRTNPSAPPDTARVTIRVECAETLPSKWKVLLEKSLHTWSNTTLFKQVGESCSIGRIQFLTGQDLAEVEISPSKALNILKKMKKANLFLKGFKPITTVHFLVDGTDPGKELHNSGPTVEQKGPSMPEVRMFFNAVVDLDEYSPKVQKELIKQFGNPQSGNILPFSGNFNQINQFYREVCNIVGGSRASLMRNDPIGAAMPPKTEPSGTPSVLTVPLSQYWYFSRAFQKELSQFKKKFGVKIDADISVSLSAVDENSSHKLPEVTQKFTEFYQQSTYNLDSVQIPPTQLESEIVKQVVRSIQTDDKVRMSLDMSADKCLLFGPDNYISSVRNQMDLEYGMDLAKSFNDVEMKTETMEGSGWSSPALKSLEMDIKNPEGPIVMTEMHWELMKTTSQQIHDIEQKYGVKFSAVPSQGCTKVTVQSMGTQPVNLESLALRAFMHLYQKVTMSAVACTLKTAVDRKTVTQAMETLGFQDSLVQVTEKDGIRKLVGLPKHLGPAVFEIENLVGKPVFDDQSKQLIGYPGQFIQLSRNRSRLQGVDTSKGAFWTFSNSGGPNINPKQATAGGAQAKGSDNSWTDGNCPICVDKFTNKKKLRCGHEFCRECLETSIKIMGEKCPACMEIFGIRNQPEGKMTHRQSPLCLPGYPLCGTIEIEYDIPDGIQTNKHPNPGKLYVGTHCWAYLPDNDEGRHVLKLLQRAFDQKLIFTIGTSTTTGIENSVIWNDIHHKTSTTGGSYGYPDPDYLRRVKEELKSKGIE